MPAAARTLRTRAEAALLLVTQERSLSRKGVVTGGTRCWAALTAQGSEPRGDVISPSVNWRRRHLPPRLPREIPEPGRPSAESDDEDVDTADVSCVPADALRNVEADTYWCMSRLLDGIQVSPPEAAPPRGVPLADFMVLRVTVCLRAHTRLWSWLGGTVQGSEGPGPPLQSPIPAGIPPPRPTRPPVTVVLPPQHGGGR
ncbi:hypothetical protein J1605_020543 [Eschrichtius robustus]|uniref:Uncharacterized protein n=1 Tax=Eschrichtius robustus TaxID=9764 RepID=A0AB34HJD6_ESCRO|nr:hypothetical protein J1605_020543 [Eschrichtius robustus]